MPDIKGLVSDPEFAALPMTRKRAVLERVGADPSFVDELLGPSGKKTPAEILRSSMGRAGSFGTTPTPEDISAAREAGIPGLTVQAMLAAPTLAAGAALPGAISSGLRGLSAAGKAGQIAKAGGTLAKEGVKFYAADQGMKAVGVPGEARAAVLGVAGVTRPGEAARKTIGGLLRGGAGAVESKAAPVVADEAKQAFIAASRARREAAAADALSKARQPAAAASKAIESADTAEIVLQLQQQMGTVEGRRVVRELLEKMPKEQASQIRLLLARREAKPATVFTRAPEAKPAGKPGAELARLLGQIP
jgi:hypothetical protein